MLFMILASVILGAACGTLVLAAIFFYCRQGQNLSKSPLNSKLSTDAPLKFGRISVNWMQRKPVGLAVSSSHIFCAASTRSGGLGLSIADEIAREGHYVDLCDGLHDSLSSVALSPGKWGLLILVLDDFLDRFDLIEALDEILAFRSMALPVPVLLLSTLPTCGECDIDVNALSDYYISLPATADSIFASIFEALESNLVAARANAQQHFCNNFQCY